MTDVYQVFINGNELVYTHSDYFRCRRKAVWLARDSSNYVELWCVHPHGSRVLLKYWN